jgi:D-alanine--poly(phosphoribitol) ligase subunit 2|nr:acyl carrier protein [uncultured Schaedlerella sp.]
MMKTLRERVLQILQEVRHDVDFEKETKLIDDGILDSFDIIAVVSELNENFEIEITADELEPENFNTLDAVVELVESLQ